MIRRYNDRYGRYFWHCLGCGRDTEPYSNRGRCTYCKKKLDEGQLEHSCVAKDPMHLWMADQS